MQLNIYKIIKLKGDIVVKRSIILVLIILVFIFILHQYTEQETKETFNVNVKTTEEITEELIIAFLIENINKDVQNYYSQYYSGEIAVYNYEIAVLQVEKQDTNSITVKVGVTPQVGAHNPLGYDEISYGVDVRGNVTLKNYEHIKTYSVPEKFQELWIKEIE